MTLTSTAFAFIDLSMIAQLLMTQAFFKEALITPLGRYCRVKCTLAGLSYLLVASLLAWVLLNASVNHCPQ